MRIIQGANVDLIEPFPASEIKRLVGWMHCYRTTVSCDDSPQTDETIASYLLELFKFNPSFGVIDRNNKLNYKHDAPLIGVIYLEAGATPRNCYIHVTSTRRAWGSGLIDEAGKLVIQNTFNSYPSLQRISAAILNFNKPAKNLAKRVGFKQDGLFKDFITQNGVPKAIAHFGLTRRDFESCQDFLAVAKPQEVTNSTKEPVLEQTQAASPTQP